MIVDRVAGPECDTAMGTGIALPTQHGLAGLPIGTQCHLLHFPPFPIGPEIGVQRGVAASHLGKTGDGVFVVASERSPVIGVERPIFREVSPLDPVAGLVGMPTLRPCPQHDPQAMRGGLERFCRGAVVVEVDPAPDDRGKVFDYL